MTEWAAWLMDLMDWTDDTVDDSIVSYVVMMFAGGLLLIEIGYWHDWFQRRRKP